MLADHNAVESHVPHHCRAVPPGFKFVIDLLTLVGTLDRRATFVNEFPFFRIARRFSEKSGIVLGFRIKRTTVFSYGTTACRCTSPFATMEFVVGSVWFHRVSVWANRNPFGRDLNRTGAFAGCILLGANIQINEGLHVLILE